MDEAFVCVPLLDCVTGSSSREIPSTWQAASCRRGVNCCGTEAAFNIHQQNLLLALCGWRLGEALRGWETGESLRRQRDVGKEWFPLTYWANNLQNKTLRLNCSVLRPRRGFALVTSSGQTNYRAAAPAMSLGNCQSCILAWGRIPIFTTSAHLLSTSWRAAACCFPWSSWLKNNTCCSDSLGQLQLIVVVSLVATIKFPLYLIYAHWLCT